MEFPRPRVEYLQPFVDSAFEILGEIAHAAPQRGALSLRVGRIQTTAEVTSVTPVNGDLAGAVLYATSLLTATKLAGGALEMPVSELDDLAASTVAELGNMISGGALAALEQQGLECNLAPSALIRGIGAEVVTTVPALIIPLTTDCGDMEISLALAPAPKQKPRSSRVARTKAPRSVAKPPQPKPV